MSTAPDELIAAIAKEAERLAEEALYNQAGHDEETRRWGRFHLWLGIPATLLAAAAGLTALSGTGFWPGLVAGLLAFAVAAISGLTTFLDPKTQAANQNKAANAYRSLGFDCRGLYEIECKRMTIQELDKALRELNQRLDKLDEETPMISSGAMEVASKKVEAGDYSYEVDQRKRF